jgi:hypothetical protein
MRADQTSTITICCSSAFYRHAAELQDQLEELGYTVIVPETVYVMKEKNDYEVSHYKTWFADEGDYPEKARLMRAHFDEIVRGDAVLVLNDEKHGQPNYIGGNVLMEMAIAFHLEKPIFIFYDLPHESAYMEELKGLLPTVLHGDVKKLVDVYPPAAT